MLTNMPGFPGERWHDPASGTDLRRDVQLAGVDLATIEHTIEKHPLVRSQIEQEGEPVRQSATLSSIHASTSPLAASQRCSAGRGSQSTLEWAQ